MEMKKNSQKALEKILDNPKLLCPAVSAIAAYSFGLNIYGDWKKNKNY